MSIATRGCVCIKREILKRSLIWTFLRQESSLKQEVVWKCTENKFALKVMVFRLCPREQVWRSQWVKYSEWFFPKEQVLYTLLTPESEKRVWYKFLIWEILTTVNRCLCYLWTQIPFATSRKSFVHELPHVLLNELRNWGTWKSQNWVEM